MWYFAHRVASGSVPVVCPVPPDADPPDWSPDRDAIARLQGAGLIVLNGARYESWTGSASLPLSRVVNSASPFKSEFITYKTTTHAHGSRGSHSHIGTDGYTWMDPQLAHRQAHTIAACMTRRWPAHERTFRDNLSRLAADLNGLDRRLQAIAPAARGVFIASNHPAYNYLSRRYALAIVPLDVPPDAPPTDDQWNVIESSVVSAMAAPAMSASEQPTRIMLFEAEPLGHTASTLRERWGITVVLFDPCETMPANPELPAADYIARMSANIDRLEQALRPPSPSPAQ